MFRFYLRQKVLDGGKSEKLNGKSSRKIAQENAQNRRHFDRFPIDRHELTILNDQDILLVRELSNDGFCATVSESTYERFAIGDMYDGRIRYFDGNFDLRSRVAWKRDGIVGFEVIECSTSTRRLLKRLIQPIEVASSLAEIDANFLSAEDTEKLWYHSEKGDDFYVWLDQSGSVNAWELITQGNYVVWTRDGGFETGSIKGHLTKPNSFISNATSNQTKVPDRLVDHEKRTFAMDVILALTVPIREEILPLIAG